MSTPDFQYDDDEIGKLQKERAEWMRSAKTAWREITNLKRRLAFVRGTLKANSLLVTLKYDDDSRRRFERAEKKRIDR